jgi:hypothetical protein
VTKWVLVPAAGIYVLLVGLLCAFGVVVGVSGGAAAPACGPNGSTLKVPKPWKDLNRPRDEDLDYLTPEELTNATVVVSTIRTVTEGFNGGPPEVQVAPGAGRRAAEVALVVTWVESNLRNLNYGDADSLGLFQQRQEYYPVAVSTDPVRATRAFLVGLPGVKGLVHVPDWPGMEIGAAAVRVQKPAQRYEFRYYEFDEWAAAATQLLWAGVPVCAPDSVAPQPALHSAALPLARDLLPRDEYDDPHHDYPAVDLAVPTGTPAYAMVPGTVSLVDDDRCGTGIVIAAGDGGSYVYCHLSAVDVGEGASVVAGQYVGATGDTGRSTGPHLHIGIKVGETSRCPQTWLLSVYDGLAAPNPLLLPTVGCSY